MGGEVKKKKKKELESRILQEIQVMLREATPTRDFVEKF